MRLLFDQNLSHRLIASLVDDFAGSARVRDVGLATSSDSDVWKYAAANGFAIVSKDYDFQQRALLFGHPPKVIWIRLGNCRTEDISALLFSRKSEIDRFEADPLASFLALS